MTTGPPGWPGTAPGTLIDWAAGVTLDGPALTGAARRRRAGLARAGVRPGHRVILAAGNQAAFFVDALALWSLGACVVPVDPGLAASEIATLAKHAEARLVLLASMRDLDLPPGCQAALTGEPAGAPGPDGGSEPDADPGAGVGEGPSWDDPAVILYTSGSTGDPKGVLHTHRSLAARLFLLREHVQPERVRRSLCLLPTHFGHGLICNALYPLSLGATLVLLPSFSLDVVGQLGSIIDEHGITFMSSVPAVWRVALQLAAPPTRGTLELVHCGSAPLGAQLHQGIVNWTATRNVKNTYGITETGSWLAGNEDDPADFSDGLVGHGWGTELAVVPEGDEPDLLASNRLPNGIDGMIWARTPALMQGYYRRPDLTREAVRNTWFRTGDVGHLDERGRLVLVGRRRHEINKAGMKIFPEDIDLALERNPEITDACCFAVPDDIAGQNVAVAVVPRDAATFDLDRLRTWLADRLSPHKQPARWYVLPAIPRSSRGKVNRETVAQRCLETNGDG